jgi:hypothetical protein
MRRVESQIVKVFQQGAAAARKTVLIEIQKDTQARENKII